MTFSILARDPQTGAIGAAAATGNLAVGAWVLGAAPGAGAVASQGLAVSTLWGDRALAALSAGTRPEAAIHAVTGGDSGRDFRQLAVLAADGTGGAWTGTENLDAKGHSIGPDWVIAGNWLASRAVLEAVERRYRAGAGAGDFAARLIDTLAAGAEAGSDARGTQSAALRVVDAARPPLDLRVDCDRDPIARLRALHARTHDPNYRAWLARLPTLAEPERH